MEIIHQLTFKTRDEPKLFRLLEKFGIQYKAIDLPNHCGQSISVMISELNSIWPIVLPFLEKKDILHSFETIFSEREILEAEWVRIVDVVEKGYPQPEQTWVINPNNYEQICSACGIFQQIKPFRIAKEPKLGRKSFMSLIWTGDSLFTTPEVVDVWKDNHIQGFETWEVILHAGNTPAKNILQIFIPNITSPGLLEDAHTTKTFCPECGISKYAYHRYGKMVYRKSSIPTGLDIVRTYEWFGSGHFAFREILISKKLARTIIENKWSGLRMKVVQVV